MKLNVLNDDLLVGIAEADATDRFAFAYDDGRRQVRGFPLSVSLPTTQREYAPTRAHPYFANLLPEGASREALARRLGVSTDNDAELLAALGTDTAGALLFSTGAAGEPRVRRPIALEQLAEWSTGIAPVELADGPIRLSLAGAQHKTSAVVDGDGWALPGTNEPSTHILKFDSPQFPWLCVNEYFVTKVAQALKLQTCEVELRSTADRPYLAVTRYDRRRTHSGVQRLHQEDFCQAFALPPTRKYEAEGGPSLASIAKLLRQRSQSGVIDTTRLMRWVVFCAVAGNADGHAKNLSLLYAGSGFRLAPHYDLVCTRAFTQLDPDLAFAIGGVRNPDRLDHACWEAFAAELQLPPPVVLRELADQLAALPAALDAAAQAVQAAIGDAPPLATIHRTIEKRARALR